MSIFTIWNWSSFQAKDIGEEVFEETDTIKILENDDLISFKTASSNSRELIFFPSGLTDPYSYTPLARSLCEAGLTVHIVKMPWRMPKFGYKKINELFDLTDSKKTFFLGGHSQGAKMAAQYVYENPGKIDALIIMGTSHPRDIDLSLSDIPTLKLYAEFDGLASVEEVLENKIKLPMNTELRLIKGGNHSQFGNLGKLLLDNEASINRKSQQALIVSLILEFLSNNRYGNFFCSTNDKYRVWHKYSIRELTSILLLV